MGEIYIQTMNRLGKKTSNSENLDEDFKKILCVIRSHIPFINSNAYLMQCRIWLEKLSSSDDNKTLRNLYLQELCEQIRENRLFPPFDKAPPTGPLQNLAKILMKNKYPSSSVKGNLEENSKHLFRYKKKKVDATVMLTLNKNASRMGLKVPNKCDRFSLGKLNRPKSTFENSQNQSFDCGEPINSDKFDDTCKQSLNNDFNDDSWSDFTDDNNNTNDALFSEIDINSIQNVSNDDNFKNESTSLQNVLETGNFM